MRQADLDLVHRYVDGELEERERTDFEERLAREETLRSYVQGLAGLDRAAGSLEIHRAPEVDFPARFPLKFFPASLSMPSFLAGVAAAVVCVLLGIGMGGRFYGKPPASPGTMPFRLVYHAPDARSVSVVGDFNNWSREIPMKPRGREGYWMAEISVPPGEYRYILLVDGKDRVSDPMADYVIDDDFGSKNSVVRIGL